MAQVYIPKESRDWKAIVRDRALYAMDGRKPFVVPVVIKLLFRLPVRPSWPEWKRRAALEGKIEPSSKPDLDNLEKPAKDALKGVVWADDAQVVKVEKSKAYHERPGLWILVVPRRTAPANCTKAEFIALTTPVKEAQKA